MGVYTLFTHHWRNPVHTAYIQTFEVQSFQLQKYMVFDVQVLLLVYKDQDKIISWGISFFYIL